jgi:hypothetical protein
VDESPPRLATGRQEDGSRAFKPGEHFFSAEVLADGAPMKSREQSEVIGRLLRRLHLSIPGPRLNFLTTMLSFQSPLQATEGDDA